MFDIAVSLSPTKTKFGPLLFAGNLDEGLKNAKDLGYKGIELSLLDSKNIDQKWLLARLEKLNLKVFAIATGQSYINDGYSLFDAEESNRLNAVERLKGHIDIASKLGSMVIIGGVRGKLTESADNRELEKAKGKMALRECLKYAEERNVILLIEPINRYETNLINTLQEGIELIEELGFYNLKLLPDTFHMNIEEKSIEESLIKAKRYMKYIHFADSNRRAPGFGHTNFESIISTLVKINYKNAIGLEVFPEPDDYLAAKQAIYYLRFLDSKISK
ncbi:MAG: sugar phosphate isomerase/epimerase [Actinobacteria bacterium]|nr:sugar phosphate isomerase/epimerase [Actinomycetota bacterium]MCL6087445.1 sugar phosphate isomerase/epimerase [Actinomycetota bacterium]